MKSHQCVALLGFVLSQVNAAPAAQDFVYDQDIVKDLTQMVLKPDDVIKQLDHISPKLQFVASAHGSLYDNMLVQGTRVASSYLYDAGAKESSAIVGSIRGYTRELADHTLDPKIKAERLAIYHDSVYSRLRDIHDANPAEFPQRAQMAKNFLSSLLTLQVSSIHQPFIKPMGSKENLEAWTTLALEHQRAKGPEYQERVIAATKVLPPAYPLNAFNYLKPEEVIEKLKGTGAEIDSLLVTPPPSAAARLDSVREAIANGATQHKTPVPAVASSEQAPTIEAKPAQRKYITETHLKEALDAVKKNKAASNKVPVAAKVPEGANLPVSVGA